MRLGLAPVELGEEDYQRRYDDTYNTFNSLFQKKLWSNASYGGVVISEHIKEIITDGKVPRRLKNLTMICVWHTSNWNDEYTVPRKFFKRHNIKLKYERYIPADNVYYYLVNTKDVNFIKTVMTQEEQEEMQPKYLDLDPFYKKLRSYSRLVAFW